MNKLIRPWIETLFSRSLNIRRKLPDRWVPAASARHHISFISDWKTQKRQARMMNQWVREGSTPGDAGNHGDMRNTGALSWHLWISPFHSQIIVWFLRATFSITFTLLRVSIHKMTQRISQFCSEFERKQEQLQMDVFLQLEIRTQVKLCLTFPGPCPGLFPGLFPGPFTGPFLTELDFQLRTDQQTDRKQKSALIKPPSVIFKVFPAPELIQTVSPGKKPFSQFGFSLLFPLF